MHAHVRFVIEGRELFHLARLEAGARFLVALYIDIVAVREREHLAVQVEACAAEHPPRGDLPAQSGREAGPMCYNDVQTFAVVVEDVLVEGHAENLKLELRN